jgi:hypothetical protein
MTNTRINYGKPEIVNYGKPEIADYGDLRELTAGCNGEPRDFQGRDNALTAHTSAGNCTST